MKREEYRAILGRCPITNPTREDMMAMCPHLTGEEVAKVFEAGHGFVACPPLRVRHGFQIVSFYRDGSSSSLEWSYAGRTPESYVGRAASSCTPCSHMDKAMRFAEENWGEDLILDDWADVIEIAVEDPTDLTKNGYPRTKAVLYVTLSRDLNDIINDGSKPISELFDEAVSQMTLDHHVWHELKGGRGGHSSFGCAHCGEGLGLGGCPGCGHRFRDNQLRCGGYTLSRKMVAFLKEHGHVFKVDPEIAWAKERQEWERIRRKYA